MKKLYINRSYYVFVKSSNNIIIIIWDLIFDKEFLILTKLFLWDNSTNLFCHDFS